EAEAEYAVFKTEVSQVDFPTSVDFADDITSWNLDVFEENLVELRLAGHLLQGANRNARAMHVNKHVSQPLVFWRIGISADDTKAIVGEMAKAGPGFLAVDYERVAFKYGLGAQRSKVGSRVWLGVPLTPDLIGAQDFCEESFFLFRSAVGNQGRA